MEFNIQYSHSKDLENYIHGLRNNRGSAYGINNYQLAIKFFNKKFIDKVVNAKNNPEAEMIILKHWLKSRDKDFVKNVNQTIEIINNHLCENKEKIISRLEKLYGQKFPFEKIGIYLTSFYSYPYWYPSFFTIPITRDPAKIYNITIHELNHFMYYFYLENKSKEVGLTQQQSENFKESLAVLTSPDPENENKYKSNIKPIQDFVYQYKNKNINEIFDLVVSSGILKQ